MQQVEAAEGRHNNRHGVEPQAMKDGIGSRRFLNGSSFAVAISRSSAILFKMSEKKPRAALKWEKVSCLRCGKKFKSPDKRHVRLCPNCKLKR